MSAQSRRWNRIGIFETSNLKVGSSALARYSSRALSSSEGKVYSALLKSMQWKDDGLMYQ